MQPRWLVGSFNPPMISPLYDSQDTTRASWQDPGNSGRPSDPTLEDCDLYAQAFFRLGKGLPLWHAPSPPEISISRPQIHAGDVGWCIQGYFQPLHNSLTPRIGDMEVKQAPVCPTLPTEERSLPYEVYKTTQETVITLRHVSASGQSL